MSVRTILILVGVLAFTTSQPSLLAQQSGAPKDIKSEQSLTDRYVCVVKDILKFCEPENGFWIDLGAGKGQVGIPLIEATSNPVVMLDPNVESMTKGLEIARERGFI